ncbi:MAG TPA: ABC transporter permease, partial [Candidatus Omnitrophota bacterium]|nr:ABC transporter permease [Candidatus Omnitrophota bacterium]
MKAFSKYFNLFVVLSRAHLRSSDYRSVLGALWSFVGPLLTFTVLYFIFVERFGPHIPLFPSKLLAGIILLTFFYRVVAAMMQAVNYSQGIVVHSLTPSEIIFLSALSVPVVKFAVEITLFISVTVMLATHQIPNIPLLFSIAVLFLLSSAGIGLWLGTLNSIASDTNEVWMALSPLLMFTSPIFYSLDMLSPWGRSLVFWINPLTPYILCYQTIISGEAVPYF